MLCFSLQNGRQMLIHKEGKENTNRALGKGKRKVEDQKRLKQAVHGRKDRLIETDDDVHRDHDLRIKGIRNEIIDGNAHQGGGDRTNEGSKHRALLRADAGIDQTCGINQGRADDKIGKLTDTCRASDKKMKKIF